MDNLYYKEYFDLERHHWYFVARAKIIMTHLRGLLVDREGVRILNVGAGTGHSSLLLEALGQVQSLEYDAECCRMVLERLGIDIVAGSILALPFEDNSFDLVCAFDVIEHVEDDQLAVREMERVCRDNGIVCVTVPAFMFLWSQHDVVNHHFRRYRRKTLLSLFDRSGMVRYHSYFNFWLFIPIAVFRVLSSWLRCRKVPEGESGSDFSVLGRNKLVDAILQKIFASESLFIRSKFRLPFGVSILASWQKTNSSESGRHIA